MPSTITEQPRAVLNPERELGDLFGQLDLLADELDYLRSGLDDVNDEVRRRAELKRQRDARHRIRRRAREAEYGSTVLLADGRTLWLKRANDRTAVSNGNDGVGLAVRALLTDPTLTEEV